MATQAEILAEAYRRNLLPADKRAVYEEAMRRGIVPGPAQQAPQQRPPAPDAEPRYRKVQRAVQSALGDWYVPDNPASLPEVGRRLDAGARGAADMVSFSWADEIAAAGEAALGAGGKGDFNTRYNRRLEAQRARDQQDREQYASQRQLGQGAGFAMGVTRAPAVVVPRLAQRGAAKAGETVVRGAVGGGVAGAAAGAGAATNDKAAGARQGATFGAVLGPLAPVIAHPLVAASQRLVKGATPVVENALSKLFSRVGPASANPGAVAARGQVLADVGIKPNLLNALDESGKGVVRAAASRMTPAREEAQRYAESQAVNLQGRIGTQARRLSDDPRSPSKMREDIAARRKKLGDRQFGAVREQRVELSDDAVLALRSPDGRDAIRAAARSSSNSLRPEDRAIAAELNRLADEVLDQPGQVHVTVGMSQKISEGLFDAAESAQRSGNNFAARQLGDLARAVRGNAKDQVAGYGTALDNYATNSALLEATELGEQILTMEADEFASLVGKLSPEGRKVANAAARRAIERVAGKVNTAPGVARNLATGQELGRKMQALNPQQAGAVARGAEGELKAVRDAAYIAPNFGSKTQGASQDAMEVAGVYDVIKDLANGPPGWIRQTVDYMKSRGLSNDESEALVRIAIDPDRYDEALRILASRQVPQAEAEALVTSLQQRAGVAAGSSNQQ